jgi:hypothetical protein
MPFGQEFHVPRAASLQHLRALPGRAADQDLIESGAAYLVGKGQ